MKLRTVVPAALILVGGLLAIPGSIGVWQERAVLDEDAFVDTVDEAFQAEEVEIALGNRLTGAVMRHLEIGERIGAGLEEVDSRRGEDTPEGLVLLQGPLTDVAREAVFRVTLRLLDDETLRGARETALRVAHRTVKAIIEDDTEFLRRSGDTVILDLGVILEQVIRDIGGDRAEEFLARAEIPPDAGQIELTDKSEISFLWDAMDFLHTYYPVWAGVAIVLFALAVIVSGARRLTLVWVGAALVLVAAAEILVVGEFLKDAFVDSVAEPDGKSAAAATYDILVDSFKRQELFVILIGVGLMGGGLLAGESRLARSLRATLRSRDRVPQDADLAAWVRERALTLRIAGLIAGGVFLVAWPEPSTRLTITVLAIVALYLALVSVASSDAGWATWARSRFGDFWDRYFRAPVAAPAADGSRLGWLAARAAYLRAVGLLVGAVLLIALPNVPWSTVLVVLAIEMLYFAAIDFLINHGRPSGAAR